MLFLIASAAADPGWTLLLPFGVGAYTHEHPGRGVIYTLTQTAGIALTVTATLIGDKAVIAGREEDAEVWRYITAGSASFASASYFVSVLDASRLHQLEQEPQSWYRPGAYPQEIQALKILPIFEIKELPSRYFFNGAVWSY
jgi:hypothetical protein